MLKIKLKDNSELEVEEGLSVIEIAKKISEGLARVATCAEIDGEVVDLRTIVEKDCSLNILTFESSLNGKKAYWHTTSHIMAQAIKRLYPEIKLAIGPSIDNGFYYDFDTEKPFTPEMLEAIEKEMKKIIKEDLPIERFELPRKEAIKFMEEKEEPYKVELINDLPEDAIISFYKQGEFTDLCAGPHVMSTGKIKAVKLLSSSGAYWRGNEKNKMLQRIYGISFPKASQVDEYVNMIEEAKKRDHRKLGKELELFFFDETAPGMAYWMPKGFTMMNTLIDFWRKEHKKRGYQEFSGPQLNSSELWKISGHWDHYKEDMFVLTDADGNEQALKPMNCPNSIKIYQSKLRSYKDLPLRFNDVDVIHRNEKSGQLNGLFRVRMFRQDDSHNYITEEQIGSEIKDIIEIAKQLYSVFGLEYKLTLSTRPEEDFMGEIETWDKAENDLRKVLDEICGEGNYQVNEGDGAFYGPKIDIKMKDCLGREWQMGTVQLDFQLPQRFNLHYIDKDGNKKTPIMVHRALFGSFDRFIGIITEHFAGAFPTWLAPVQVRILPIADSHKEYAEKLKEKLEEYDIRVELDEREEKIGYKIREAQLQKIPYMLIVGDKEVEANAVGVRSRKDGDIGAMSVEDFINKIEEEIKTFAR
ncbi:MAG: threonine--tRNA ligase [Clostridia bacterium]|jgi:threonyl-tRNA synthetase|nr:threonine--tRNA ligase [Clostridium sp. CAG:452]